MKTPQRPAAPKSIALGVLSIVLIVAGAGLGWWSLQRLLAAPDTPSVPALAAKPSPAVQAQKPTVVPLLKRLLPATATPTPTATATPVSLRLALPEPLPPDLRNGLMTWMEQQAGSQLVADRDSAVLWLTTDPAGAPLLERYYVPVARFASFQDDIRPPELLALWLGGPAETGRPPLVVDQQAAAALTLLWGKPGEVEIVPDIWEVAGALRQDPERLGIVPFDQLIPQLHVLSVDGNDPTDNRFVPQEYPLTLRLYLRSRPAGKQAVASLRDYLERTGLATNRDPTRLTVLIMTGVTAMSRITAERMERNGYDYPAQVVGPTLSAADLTHISNEVPFVPNCQVNTRQNNVILCSKPEYMAALRAVGVDLVGLTGNHLNDFGKEASLTSLQFYADEGLPVYGGGIDESEAWQPLLIDHNGNRLAFLGANAYGPQLAWAEPDWPGAAPYDYETMARSIQQARQQGADLVLVELQWEESYDTLPLQSQRDEFRLLSAAGADIVTGVQSHVPQAIEFGQGGLILYGLGNFFFDQMWSQETRQGLIPRHTIYDGRHLSTRLLTTVLEDYAQPRWATDAERKAILGRVFTASGW